MPMKLRLSMALLVPSSASLASLVSAVQSLQPEDVQMPGSHQAHKAWDESTKMSEGAEITVASCWVILLAGVPLLVKYLDGRPATRTQLLVGGVMWLALFGGYYLFTNVVIFQSGHFSPPRTLTIVECTYLMSQVITTVGYGDITPAYPRGQIFVGLYVLMALFVIANVMSDLVAHITESAKRYRARRAAPHEEDQEAALSRAWNADRPSVAPLVGSLGVFFLLALCWVLFFHYYPGEEKTWLQAVYFSIITYSTVGFGWFTPVTQGGMVFASFFMLFGSSALVAVVASFTELMVKLGDYEKFDHQAAVDAVEAFEAAEEMTELEFLTFGLKHTRGGDEKLEQDIERARRAFKALAESGQGQAFVSIAALEESTR